MLPVQVSRLCWLMPAVLQLLVPAARHAAALFSIVQMTELCCMLQVTKQLSKKKLERRASLKVIQSHFTADNVRHRLKSERATVARDGEAGAFSRPSSS